MNLYNLLSKQITQQELLNYYNATIIYDNLPKNINGCVTNYRGINLIFINTKLSHCKKRKTILHEFAHIELNHLSPKNSVVAFSIENIEDEADNYISFLLKNIEVNNYDI